MRSILHLDFIELRTLVLKQNVQFMVFEGRNQLMSHGSFQL